MYAKTLAAVAIAMMSALQISASSAQTSQKVSIGVYPGTTGTFLPWIASERGFYRSNSLDATLVNVASGPMMTSNIASQSVDIGQGPVSNLAVARERGLDLMFISANSKQIYSLMVRNGVALPGKGKYPQVMNDLKGLNWGSYGRGSDGENLLKAMAIEAGLDAARDMTLIGIGGPVTGIPAMKTGKIDVYMAAEPTQSVLQAEGVARIVVDMRKGEGPANFKGVVYNGFFGLRSTIEARPEVFKAVTAAHEQAYCWGRNPANFDGVLALLKDKLPKSSMNDEQYAAMVKEGLEAMTIAFSDFDFQAWNGFLTQFKLINAPLSTKDGLWSNAPRREPKC